MRGLSDTFANLGKEGGAEVKWNQSKNHPKKNEQIETEIQMDKTQKIREK